MNRVVQFVSMPLTVAGRASRELAMSLIEIIIVISLIGVIMTIVVTTLTSKQDEAMIDATKLAMGNVGQALQLYRAHHYRYPTAEAGLDALVTKPGTDTKWRGPYIEASKLKDPWGGKFVYESDGRNFKIISVGPDEQQGTEDDLVYPEEEQAQP